MKFTDDEIREIIIQRKIAEKGQKEAEFLDGLTKLTIAICAIWVPFVIWL